MTEYVPYGQRCVDAVLNSPTAIYLTPGEVDRVKGWGRQQDEQEAAQVRTWAAEQSHRAYADQQACLEVANEVYDFMADVQTQANERRIDPSQAVAALRDAEQRLTRVRELRQRVADQMARATYLNDQPHQFLDDTWKRFPAMGERPIPPHGDLIRGV